MCYNPYKDDVLMAKKKQTEEEISFTELFGAIFGLFWEIFKLAAIIILLPLSIFLGTSFDALFKDAIKFNHKDSD